MNINRYIVIVFVLFFIFNSVVSFADEIAERVITVSKKLGCELPYFMAEDSDAGLFYAETRVKTPERMNALGFSSVQPGYYVSIRESIPGEYWIKVVPKHDMLQMAEEQLLVFEQESAIQKTPVPVASGIIIKGVIANIQDIRGYFSPSTYLQMVNKSSGLQAKEIITNGFINIESDLPKIGISGDGSFELKTNILNSGIYLLYLQNFKPATSTKPSLDPILAKGENYYQVVISEKVKSLIFDCGKLSVKKP